MLDAEAQGRVGLPADSRAQDAPADTRTCCSLHPKLLASFGVLYI